MSENKQNQSGMGKDIIKLIIRNKIIVALMLLAIVSGIFYNLYSSAKDKDVLNEDQQALLNELTGKQQQVDDSTKEGQKIVKAEEEIKATEEVQFNGNTDVANTTINKIQENDFYIIEVIGGRATADSIIVDIKYQVKERPSDVDNNLIYLSTTKSYLATPTGNLPLKEITGIGLLPLEYSLQKHGADSFTSFETYISNISSEERLPTSFEIQGTLVFKKPDNLTNVNNSKLKIVSMPLALNTGLDNYYKTDGYDEYKDELFIKPYKKYYKNFIFEDMLTVSFQSQE